MIPYRHILLPVAWVVCLAFPLLALGQHHSLGNYPELNSISWFPTFGEKEDDLIYAPEKSPWVMPLDGKWYFHWTVNESDFPLSPKTLEFLPFTPMNLPSNWQRFEQYDPPTYGPGKSQSTAYIGIYKRSFKLPENWKGGLLFLRLEGGGPVLSIHLNGKLITTSKLGDMGASFLLDPHLKKGTNTLYIQCIHNPSEGRPTPSWNLSGLDRQVYLFYKQRIHIQQLTYEATQAGVLQLEATIKNLSKDQVRGSTIEFKLIDKNDKVQLKDKLKVKEEQQQITFQTQDQLPYVYNWSAEKPYLYTLVLTIKNRKGKIVDQYRKKVGFNGRTITETGLRLNGKDIELRGVHYRMFHPDYGYALPLDQLQSDLIMMKAHHINTIFLDQMAPAPLYQLCEKMGMYVVSKFPSEAYSNPAYLKRRLKWERQFAAICLQILPNGYQATDSAYPIPQLLADQFSHIALIKQPSFTRGDARDSLESLHGLPSIAIIGGWADQPLSVIRTKKESSILLGGYSPETYPNTPPYLDGLLEGNRHAQPELKYLEESFAPVQLDCRDAYVNLKHSFSFLNLSKVELHWELLTGDSIKTGSVPLRPYFPNFTYKIPYPFGKIPRGACLRLYAFPQKNHPHLNPSTSLGNGHYCPDYINQPTSTRSSSKLTVIESITDLNIYSPEFQVSFDKGMKMLERIWVRNEEILANPPFFNFFPQWETSKQNLLIQGRHSRTSSKDDYQVNFDRMEVFQPESERVQVKYTGTLVRSNKDSYKLMCNYLLYGNGKLVVDLSLESIGKRRKSLPEMEHIWPLNIQDGKVRWKETGKIPEESAITNFNFPFLVPLYPQRQNHINWINVQASSNEWNFSISQSPDLSFAISNINSKTGNKFIHKQILPGQSWTALSLGPIKQQKESGKYALSYSIWLNQAPTILNN